MSTAKSITASTLAVLALAAIPLSMQANRIEAARSELARLGKIGPGPGLPAPAAHRSSAVRPSPSGDSRTSAAPPDIQSAFRQLLAARGSGKEAMLALASLGDLDEARFSEILVEAKHFPGNQDARVALLEILAELAPPGAPQEEVFRIMLGIRGAIYRNKTLTRWAENDPEAAIRWFQEKNASGELVSTAVSDGLYKETLSMLLDGMVRTNPARAVAFFSELKTPPDGGWDHALQSLARGLGGQLAAGKSSAEFEKLLITSDKAHLVAIVQGAASTAVPEKDLEGYARFIDKYLSGPQRDEAILSHIASANVPPGEQLANMRQILPGVSESEAISRIATAGKGEALNQTRDWLEDLPAGEGRDAGLRVVAGAEAARSLYVRALSSANSISDPAVRRETVASVAESWLQNDEATARAKLPTDVLRSLPPQTAPQSR